MLLPWCWWVVYPVLPFRASACSILWPLLTHPFCNSGRGTGLSGAETAIVVGVVSFLALVGVVTVAVVCIRRRRWVFFVLSSNLLRFGAFPIPTIQLLASLPNIWIVLSDVYSWNNSMFLAVDTNELVYLKLVIFILQGLSCLQTGHQIEDWSHMAASPNTAVYTTHHILLRCQVNMVALMPSTTYQLLNLFSGRFAVCL